MITCNVKLFSMKHLLSEDWQLFDVFFCVRKAKFLVKNMTFFFAKKHVGIDMSLFFCWRRITRSLTNLVQHVKNKTRQKEASSH